MKHNKDKKQLSQEEEKAMFSNLEFSYSRSKEDVWNQLEGMMEETKQEETPVISLPEVTSNEKVRSIGWKWMSVAASLLILLSAGLFARLYTKTVSVAPGEFVSHTLPDGSEVHLNAASNISYQPYWWRFDRGVTMQGEAYFVVAKGEKFTVNAVMGSVEVLGTEFNVYARGDDFQVYCQEGKVRVTSDKLVKSSTPEVTLTRGQVAEIELNQLNSAVLLKQDRPEAKEQILSWRSGRMLYDQKPLSKVLEDVERQFGISILVDKEKLKDRIYTGSFSWGDSVENTIKLISLAMELDYEEVQPGVYQIKIK